MTTFVAVLTVIVALAAAFVVGFAVVRERAARLRADEAIREAAYLRAELEELQRLLTERATAADGRQSAK